MSLQINIYISFRIVKKLCEFDNKHKTFCLKGRAIQTTLHERPREASKGGDRQIDRRSYTYNCSTVVKYGIFQDFKNHLLSFFHHSYYICM